MSPAPSIHEMSLKWMHPLKEIDWKYCPNGLLAEAFRLQRLTQGKRKTEFPLDLSAQLGTERSVNGHTGWGFPRLPERTVRPRGNSSSFSLFQRFENFCEQLWSTKLLCLTCAELGLKKVTVRRVSRSLAGFARQHLIRAEHLHLDGGTVDAKALSHQLLSCLKHSCLVCVRIDG